jgi:putative phosphoesterase
VTGQSKTYRIGVISDTHGLLRQEAMERLIGVDVIIHAGDVGNQEVLDELEQVAPVFAVRGNMDRGEWAEKLSLNRLVEVGGIAIYVLHDLEKLDIVPESANVSLVISGHTHRPMKERKADVLFLNPGSIGPRRFNKPLSSAMLEVGAEGLQVEINFLEAVG